MVGTSFATSIQGRAFTKCFPSVLNSVHGLLGFQLCNDVKNQKIGILSRPIQLERARKHTAACLPSWEGVVQFVAFASACDGQPSEKKQDATSLQPLQEGIINIACLPKQNLPRVPNLAGQLLPSCSGGHCSLVPCIVGKDAHLIRTCGLGNNQDLRWFGHGHGTLALLHQVLVRALCAI